ncbi:MAG: hypothetical protein ACNA7Y_00235 [Gammaproteobacteria bacterium]
MDYRNKLSLIRTNLDAHIASVTKLQKQIDKEEKAIFACMRKEKSFLLKINAINKSKGYEMASRH